MSCQIIQGDAFGVLATLPDKSVHCCITSPPYFGLRSYLPADHALKGLEMGRETRPIDYVNNLVKVFSQVHRVLRDDGVLWVNLGDSYASAWAVSRRNRIGNGSLEDGKRNARPNRLIDGLKEKDLIGIPWMTAFALRDWGWYLRQDDIWHKPSCLPESVKDRCTKSHEYIFHLTKRPKYFFDSVAIEEPCSASFLNDSRWKTGPTDVNEKNGYSNAGAQNPKSVHRLFTEPPKTTRNKRSVWRITNKPYKGAHFAVFPPELVETPLLGSTSAHGCCTACGSPWKRDTKRTVSLESGSGRSGNSPEGKNDENPQSSSGDYDIRMGPRVSKETIGWLPTCKCRIDTVRPCVVIDPFCGSGTVGMVANKHRRDSILIELNPEYIPLIEQRVGLKSKAAA